MPDAEARGGRGRGSSGAVVTVTVTPPSGEKSEGQLRRIDDFIVTLLLADGTERTFRRDGDRPKVEIRDPLQGHAICSPSTPKRTCTM